MDPETLIIVTVAGGFVAYLAAGIGVYYFVEWLSRGKP